MTAMTAINATFGTIQHDRDHVFLSSEERALITDRLLLQFLIKGLTDGCRPHGVPNADSQTVLNQAELQVMRIDSWIEAQRTKCRSNNRSHEPTLERISERGRSLLTEYAINYHLLHEYPVPPQGTAARTASEGLFQHIPSTIGRLAQVIHDLRYHLPESTRGGSRAMALKHSSHHNPSYDLLPHQVVVLLRDCVLLDAFNHALANSRWRTESGQSSTQSLMDKIARKIRQNDAHVASLLSGASSGDPCPRSPEEPLPTVQLKLMVEQLSIIALFDEILSSNSNEISENTYTMSLSAARKRIEEIDQELLTLMANQ